MVEPGSRACGRESELVRASAAKWGISSGHHALFVGDGTQRMAEVALYPLFDDGSPDVAYIVAVGMDITDALAAQREREARVGAEAEALRQVDAARHHELLAVQASEEQSRKRLARLAGAALDLLHAESTRDLARIVDRGVQVLGADGGVIVVREGDEYRVAVSEQMEQNFHAEYDHLPLDSPLPGIRVARSGERVVLPDRRTGIALMAEMAQVYADTGRHAWAFVPLKVGDRLLGSLAVSWVDERHIDDNELELIEAFAAQCAQALDRIRATRAERVRSPCAAHGQGVSRELVEQTDASPGPRHRRPLCPRFRGGSGWGGLVRRLRRRRRKDDRLGGRRRWP